jgi:hypothetical protein
MSALVDRAIDAAGLAGVLAARRAGRAEDIDTARLREADLLALGAAADRVRAEEVGDRVLIATRGEAADGVGAAGDAGPSVVVLPAEGRELTGLELLREVAVARITGPRGARIRVEWTRCGLELAQVALGFGANELGGRIADKRGLPLADGAKLGVLGKKSRLEDADLVKRRELEGFVRRAGRTPHFDDGSRTPEGSGPEHRDGSRTPEGSGPEHRDGSRTPEGSGPEHRDGSRTPEGSGPEHRDGSRTPEGSGPENRRGSTASLEETT